MHFIQSGALLSQLMGVEAGDQTEASSSYTTAAGSELMTESLTFHFLRAANFLNFSMLTADSFLLSAC